MGADMSSESCMEPVFLHTYDVGGTSMVQKLNNALRGFGTGAYHTGIEVYGQEWSFAQVTHVKHGEAKIKRGTGVVSCLPRQDPNHLYRESVLLGYTKKSMKEVNALIENMKLVWLSEDYELLTKNCQSFAASLCNELCVSEMPEWVTSMARAGSRIDDSAAAHVLSAAGLQSCASVAQVANMHQHAQSQLSCTFQF